MSEQYLWDRSGPPDPEIERIERALAPLRYRHRAEMVETAPARPRLWWAAAAAVLAAAVGLSQLRAPAPGAATAWQIARMHGTASVGGRRASVDMAVHAGQALETGAGGITLQADDVGRVDLGPDSELRAATSRQLTLNRGVLHAFIWAPPREFVVNTPSARAVDLGCEYTLNVDRAGDGVVRVALGWVAFQFRDHESFIPAGAECVTRKRSGPGIPYYADAPEPLRTALSRYERGDEGALPELLASARPRDGLTLWHLLTRAPESRRGAVFDRFARLVAVPREVTREAVLRNDPRAIDLCWNALNVESAAWWRGWERRW